MPYVSQYSPDAPPREDIDQSTGPMVLEFGTDWCGHCKAAQPEIAEAFESHPDTLHRKVEDGKGRKLGRTFRVKLWPTVIFLKDGQEIDRVVRPTTSSEVLQGLKKIV